MNPDEDLQALLDELAAFDLDAALQEVASYDLDAALAALPDLDELTRDVAGAVPTYPRR